MSPAQLSRTNRIMHYNGVDVPIGWFLPQFFHGQGYLLTDCNNNPTKDTDLRYLR